MTIGEIKNRYSGISKKLLELRGHLDLSKKEAKAKELETTSHNPDFWLDQSNAKTVLKELNHLKSELQVWSGITKHLEDVKTVLDLIGDSDDADLLKEASEKLEGLEKTAEDIEFRQMLSGPNDNAGAILQINAGAGGTEACDWAEMLLRMYRRWADAHGFKNEVVDFTEGDGAGFRSAVITVAGEYAYGYLKAEIGVHRLVRISPFDANKRRHTSFASVFILPDIEDEIEIKIDEADLRIDTFRSSGAGGQKVNKTDSAVRLTHFPSGIVVACQNERSQHQNKVTAMRVLKAKLYELEMDKKRKERDAVEAAKSDIAWGSQIRSYVFQPYQMVKDHRTGFEAGNIQSVMDGEIDGFIRAFLLKK
ncbi:MAG: peptide chain release factor 2 [Deltaproteobacteria bacterium]|nr:peptide chain release factor 2 [Deltaproteobacteria bacterium]